jgi:hypothetical protein
MLRRACAPAAVAVAALLCAPSPAQADATVSPSTAVRGVGVNVTFTVTNDSPVAAITKVRLVMPPASPVAEVYPLSVPDWAPALKNRTLNPPLPGVHGGAPIDETTGEITWVPVPGRSIPPGGKAELTVAMSPMPDSDQMRFTLEATYAGGVAGPALSPVTIALTGPPAPLGQVAPAVDPDALVGSPQGTGVGVPSMLGWIVAVLCLGAAAVLWARSRRAAAADADGTTAEPATAAAPSGGSGEADGPKAAVAEADGPKAAGTDDTGAEDTGTRPRVSAWSYRDRP